MEVLAMALVRHRHARRGSASGGAGDIEIRVGAGLPTIPLSSAESRQLYVLLAESAPFVRNQLNVIYNGGGSGMVALATEEERQHVAEAIIRAAAPSNALQALRASIDCSGRRITRA